MGAFYPLRVDSPKDLPKNVRIIISPAIRVAKCRASKSVFSSMSESSYLTI
jgi:hypothetical protein